MKQSRVLFSLIFFSSFNCEFWRSNQSKITVILYWMECFFLFHKYIKIMNHVRFDCYGNIYLEVSKFNVDLLQNILAS